MQSEPQTSTSRGSRNHEFKILVVDDEPQVLRVLCMVLEQQGHQVLPAVDGVEALEIYRREEPDIVLCDNHMPGMKGLELLCAIREISDLTEVVMITGFADTEVVIDALRRGVSNFIEKPFQVNELLRQMEGSFIRCGLVREARQLQACLDQERLRRELDGRMATMGRLVAGLAHEVHNPVTFIRGNAELLKLLLGRALEKLGTDRFGPAADEIGEMEGLLTDMEFGTQRITRLVEEMKRFSSSSDSRQQVVTLVSLLDNSVRLADSKRHKSTALTVDPPRSECHLQVAPVEMECCIVNLLVNSYEALEGGGGHVAIRLTELPFRTDAFDGLLEITVADDGPGIPQGVIDEVFTPFFTRKNGGTGLGLSIAYEAAKRNGAQVQIDSHEGRGTEVTVRLPYLNVVVPAEKGNRAVGAGE